MKRILIMVVALVLFVGCSNKEKNDTEKSDISYTNKYE